MKKDPCLDASSSKGEMKPRRNSVIHIHSFKVFFSIIVYHGILNIVHCAI